MTPFTLPRCPGSSPLGVRSSPLEDDRPGSQTPRSRPLGWFETKRDPHPIGFVTRAAGSIEGLGNLESPECSLHVERADCSVRRYVASLVSSCPAALLKATVSVRQMRIPEARVSGGRVPTPRICEASSLGNLHDSAADGHGPDGRRAGNGRAADRHLGRGRRDREGRVPSAG